MKSLKLYLRIFSIIVIWGVIVGTSPIQKSQAQTGHQYYIDKASLGGTCSDSNPGTITQPWCTISKANQTLVAGDTVYLRQGSYQSELILPRNSGNSTSLITYSAYGTEKPVLSVGQYGTIILLEGKNYIKVEKLTFENVNAWVTSRNSDNNVFQNNIFRNGGGWGCFSLSQDSDFNKILNNQMSSCGDAATNEGDVIDIAHNSDDNLIEGNDISNGGHALIGVIGAWSATDTYYPNGSVYRTIIRNNNLHNEWATVLGLGYHTFDSIIENNRIYNASRGSDLVKVGIQLVSNNNIVRQNLIYNNKGSGILITSYCYEGTMCQQSVGNQIYNNTIYGNGGLGITVIKKDGTDPAGNPLKDNTIKNNIIFNNNQAGNAVDYFGTPKYFQINLDDYWAEKVPWPSDYEVENYFYYNLIFHQDPSAPVDPTNKIISRIRTLNRGGGGVALTFEDAQRLMPNNFHNNIAADPMFNNPKGVDGILGTADDDFSLKSGSPACGAGENGVDLGAFACGSSGSSLNLTKTADKTQAKSGDAITYTINYSTIAQANSVVITDSIPANTTYVPGSAKLNNVAKTDAQDTDEYYFDNTAKKATWSLGNLSQGAAGSVTFKVTVN